MTRPALHHRLARRDDIPALTGIMNLAIAELLKPYLNQTEIAASRALMGLDGQLIEDGTYFVIEQDGALAGCGGWSRRAELVATKAGEPLYRACGYQPVESFMDNRGGAPVPLLRMSKAL